MRKYEQEYLKAFNKDVASEDNVAEVDETVPEGESETPAVAVVIDAEQAVDDAADEAGIPEAEEAAVAEEAPVEEVAAVDERSPEDIQREKSWEGRLRKREEELAAREAALGEAPAYAEGGEVDDSEVNEIRAKLAEDFGDEFVAMISKLAAYEARNLAASSIDEKLAPINQTIEQAMSDVTSALQNLHFDSISRDHEDFQEIVESQPFGEYIDSLPEDKKAGAIQVLQAGTPRQVVRLLTDYKAFLSSQEKADPEVTEEDPALEAAEGVRGKTPVSLPARPSVGDEDEYKSAWASM